ncbi:MAG: response regulator [Kiritimatiellia bacterium]
METIKRKILLVDDDQSLLETLSDFLIFEGFDVLCSPSGEDALIKLRSFQPDLIILDMGMPGMGGKGFLDRITNPDGSTSAPVLVLTARSTMAEYFADKMIASFMSKPCDPADLLMEVGRIIIQFGSPKSAASTKMVRKLVVAEPDAALQHQLQGELMAAGFHVVAVSNGLEALEKAIEIKPDAVVMRLELPKMSANEVLGMLRRLPGTADVSGIVYGVTLPGVELDYVAKLTVPQSCLVSDLNVDAIVDRVMNITGA